MVRKFLFPSSPRLRCSKGIVRRAPNRDVKPKTSEDYHIAIHDKLLEARKDATDFINVNLIYCYGIVGLIVLYIGGYITKIKLSENAEFDLTKGYMLEYLAVFVIIVYTLISFHVQRLARIFHSIRENASAIEAINPKAKIIGMEDMHLYVGGLLGLILELVREQTRIIRKNTQSSANKVSSILDAAASYRERPSIKSALKMIRGAIAWQNDLWKLAPRLVLRGILISILMLIPLAAPVIAIAVMKYGDKFAAQPAGFIEGSKYWLSQVNSIDAILLVAFVYVTSVTNLSNIMLAYSRELLTRTFQQNDPIWVAHRPGRVAKVTQFWDPDEAAKLFPSGVTGAKGPPYIDGVVELSFEGRDALGREYPKEIEIVAGTSVERRV